MAEPDPPPVDEAALRLAEAMLFASATPVSARVLGQVLPEASDPDAVLAALRDRYAGRGVELEEAAGGWRFRTAPDLAPALRRVVAMPRRLPRAAMEVLALIAWHQPITRAEIEARRGASLSQVTLDSLLEAGLVAPGAQREAPGRPTEWKTTPAFLAQFGLSSLRDLPNTRDLLVEPVPVVPEPASTEAPPAD